MTIKTKHFLSFATLAVATILCGSLASCGDDGDDSSPSPVPTPVINNNGLLVTSVGKYRFTYDESGKLTGMSDGSETYTMQGDKFSWKSEDDYEVVQMDFSLNSDGCITKIRFSEKDEYESDEGTVEYSYSDHRLKSASYNAKGSNKYGTFEESGKVNYTWRDGNLIQAAAECRESGRDDGESYSDRWTANYTFTYGSKANTTRQFPYYMGEDITGFEDNVFCVLGLFGYGPAYLPTSCTEKYIEREKTETHTYTLSFTQNADGTLSSESRNGRRIDYTYGTASTRAAGIAAQDMGQNIPGLLPCFFRHNRKTRMH